MGLRERVLRLERRAGRSPGRAPGLSLVVVSHLVGRSRTPDGVVKLLCEEALGERFAGPWPRGEGPRFFICPACKAAGGEELGPEELAILQAAGLKPADIPRVQTESCKE